MVDEELDHSTPRNSHHHRRYLLLVNCWLVRCTRTVCYRKNSEDLEELRVLVLPDDLGLMTCNCCCNQYHRSHLQALMLALAGCCQSQRRYYWLQERCCCSLLVPTDYYNQQLANPSSSGQSSQPVEASTAAPECTMTIHYLEMVLNCCTAGSVPEVVPMCWSTAAAEAYCYMPDLRTCNPLR